jgi:hypothetical protein
VQRNPVIMQWTRESFLTYFFSGLKGTKLASLVEIKIKSIDMAVYITTKMW